MPCEDKIYPILYTGSVIFLRFKFPPPPSPLPVNWQSILCSTPLKTLLVTTDPPPSERDGWVPFLKMGKIYITSAQCIKAAFNGGSKYLRHVSLIFQSTNSLKICFTNSRFPLTEMPLLERFFLFFSMDD